MKIIYQLSLTVLCTSILTVSCVDKDYDLDNLKDVNTDINVGGEYFGLPIGKLNPVTLGEFIKPGDMLSVVDGKYEFKYTDTYDAEIGKIDPVNISVDVPAFDEVLVNLSNVSIDDIEMPNIQIEGSGKVNLPDNLVGVPSTNIPQLPLSVNGTAPVKILYEYSKDIKQINWIEIGQSGSTTGQLLQFDITPSYAGVLSSAQINIDSFEITFPVGFSLGIADNDPYAGKLSNNDRTYTITGKDLLSNTPIRFYVRKLTFNPAVDQQNGELTYSHDITYNANFLINGTTDPNISGTEISVNVTNNTRLSMAGSDFDINAINTAVGTETIDISVDQDLGSDMIKSISKITLTEPTSLKITIGEQGLPQQIPGMTLANYKIEFPSFLVFEDPQLNSTKTLVINEMIQRGSGLTKTVNITGFAFSTNPIQPDGSIKLSGTIKTIGDVVTIPATNHLNSNDIQNIKVTPTVTLEEMTVGVITGVIKPEIDTQPQIVDLNIGDDMAFIYDSDLDLDRIAVRINIDNTTDIAASIGIKLIPYDANGAEITQNKMEQLTGLDIKPSTNSKLWLSNTEEGMPEGYTYVNNPKINSLFRKMPSKMEADLSVSLDSQEVSIDINTPMELKIEYEVVAPLAPGSEFKLVYEDKIGNLQTDLKDFIDYISALELELNATNEIPLDLNVNAQALDSNGSNIGVSITIDGVIKAGGKGGVATDSAIKMSLKETTSGALAKLDMIKLMLVGSCNEEFAGTNLEEQQSLTLSGKAFVPGGLNINIDTNLNKE